MSATKSTKGVSSSGRKPVKAGNDLWETPSLNAVDDLNAETLVLLLEEDNVPLRGMAGFVDWRLCGRLSQLFMKQEFHGTLGERLLMPSWKRIPAPRILLFGMGPKAGFEKTAAQSWTSLKAVLDNLAAPKVALALPHEGLALKLTLEEWARERKDIDALFAP